MRDNRLEKRVEFDATVGQVWEAVSTGHGMSSWFVPHDITPPVNETDLPTAEADFGSGNTDQGRVLTWDPPHMVRYGGEAHNPTEALEFFVEPKENGGTVLRLVQSGVLGEKWEMEYHAKGWDLSFHNLDSYFRHFAPNRATNALAMAFTTIDAHAVWDRYHTALGTDRNLRIGSPVNLTPEGVEPIRGEVDLYEADSTAPMTGCTGSAARAIAHGAWSTPSITATEPTSTPWSGHKPGRTGWRRCFPPVKPRQAGKVLRSRRYIVLDRSPGCGGRSYHGRGESTRVSPA